MKHTKNILGAMLLTAVVTASCVDDKPLAFEVEKPASIAGMEYLNDYDVLKSYVSSSANPDFKLGIALAANDYIAGGLVTRLANSNFHEMTAGNAMKYASCVSDDGTMNFETVENFVSAAKTGGITIYGHTLAWHAQQNNKYLNSLIADKKVEVDPDAMVEKEIYSVNYADFSSYPFYRVNASNNVEINNGLLEVINEEKAANNWDVQYFCGDGIKVTKGENYKVTVEVKGSTSGQGDMVFGGWGTNMSKPMSFTDEWSEVTAEFNGFPGDENNAHAMFQTGHFVGTLQFRSLKITHLEAAGPATWFSELLKNGDCEGTDVSNFKGKESNVGPDDAKIGTDGTNNHCIIVKSGDNPTNVWDSQFFVTSDHVFQAGEKFQFSMRYKAEKEAKITSQAHTTPGNYISNNGVGNPTCTTEWNTLTYEGVADANLQTIAFNLSELKEANTYYFDDISWKFEESGSGIPLTPEEKKDTLTWAMNNWVEGMMKATGGYVTAWDVVNEAISGGGNDEGFYTLQSASNVSPEDAKNNFYWQDYLGNVDYVRIAVAAARKYYAENGGTAPLKLFVNDYNLESDWDDNKKAKSLVHWIEKWEADGKTKIDGIGTQMHVSCYANAVTQKSKEDHVVKMFEILAESGKLVKISELDMGYIDENGTSVKTGDMTEAQHKAMAEYYKFIVKKYFEIIPAAQQYGITQWCATDAPNDSGWRGGEPVGLWDSNYSRKHTYAGFADGLAGK